jgi:hypothetical protein
VAFRRAPGHVGKLNGRTLVQKLPPVIR